MTALKSRLLVTLYIMPCYYTKMGSCINLAWTYSYTYKSSEDSVLVDVGPKPIWELL